MNAPILNKVDWLDKILITAVNGRPGADWSDGIKEIYWSRQSVNPRVVAAKLAISQEMRMQPGDDLAQQIRKMSTRSSVYRTLKHELTARGWWKNRPRGRPNPNINTKP